MAQTPARFIDISDLRIGMYVHLDVGWMAHPFPLNAFRIASADQLQAIRQLGLKRVRIIPDKGDDIPVGAPVGATADGDAAPPVESAARETIAAAREERAALLARQRASLRACERRYDETSRAYRQLVDDLLARPDAARVQLAAVVDGVMGELLDHGESCIRLLSERAGERSSLHAVNVTVLSLLLARACGFDEAGLQEVGLGALLHDIGKIEMPHRLRWRDEQFTQAELAGYQEHVARGVALGRALSLPAGALAVLGQHHERADGGGFPMGLSGERVAPASRVVSLVNRYDNLCNPANPAAMQTPHEALALIFAQQRGQFDSAIMGSFIRMMGVYPPGSLVALGDGRHAIVVAVNSARPLKPRVVIHDPAEPAETALVVDLEEMSDLNVSRSLRPQQLPRAALDYLAPRRRICYYFERAREAAPPGGGA